MPATNKNGDRYKHKQFYRVINNCIKTLFTLCTVPVATWSYEYLSTATAGIIEVYIFTLFRFHSIKIVVPHLYTTYSVFTKRFERFGGPPTQLCFFVFFRYLFNITSSNITKLEKNLNEKYFSTA